MDMGGQPYVNRICGTFSFMYPLLCLVLLLTVTTETVERSFSAMKIVKDRLRNRMIDQWLYDLLVIYIEKGSSIMRK
jgi:hypothetical protein